MKKREVTKEELLGNLKKSYDAYFDNFNRNNGDEALKISLDCIISDYLSLKESDVLSKDENELVKHHLSDLFHQKRSSEFLSWTKDLESLFKELFLYPHTRYIEA